MRRDSETGEFELVLGNGQLLSGLFIVVLLFAVFFALGYVVGQNSPRSAKLAEAGAAPAAERPQPLTQQQPSTPPGTAGVETPSSTPADADASAQAAPTGPSATTPEGGPVSSAPAAETEEPAVGFYWQVMALKQPDAEVVARTLKDKGFPAQLAPGRNNLMRVLVGPYNDMGAMSKSKTALENLGFHPIKK